MAPPDPIVAVLGGEVLLPCSVSPAMSAEDMELRLFRSKFSEAVFIYQDRLEQKEEQMAAYTGRTSLVRDLLNQGEAVVRIQNVSVSDNGLYTCFFRKGGFYEEASLELKVAGWWLDIFDPGVLDMGGTLGIMAINPSFYRYGTGGSSTHSIIWYKHIETLLYVTSCSGHLGYINEPNNVPCSVEFIF